MGKSSVFGLTDDVLLSNGIGGYDFDILDNNNH